MAARDSDRHAHQQSLFFTRFVAAGIHLSGLVIWVIGPLAALWMAKSRELQEHAKRATNWQLTYGLGIYTAGLLMATAIMLSDFRPAIWGPMLGVVLVGGNILFCTVAAVRALRGSKWTYPVALQIKETPSISRTF